MTIAQYYQLPATTTGIGDFLTNFNAVRQQNQAIESQLEAQRDQRRVNLGVTGLATAIGGAAGAMAAPAGASAFAGGLQGANLGAGVGNMLSGGGIGGFQQAARDTLAYMNRGEDRQFDAAAQAAALASRERMPGLEADADLRKLNAATYYKQYGELPPTTAAEMETRFGPGAYGAPVQPGQVPDEMGPPIGGMGGGSEPGGVPTPTINPASTPAYREAQQLVQSYDQLTSRPLPPSEMAAIQAQYGPQVQQARQLLQRSAPPGPPRNFAEFAARTGMVPIPGTFNYAYMDSDGSPKVSTAVHPSSMTGPDQWMQLPPEKSAAAKKANFEAMHHVDQATGEEYLYDPKQGRWEKQKQDKDESTGGIDDDAFNKALALAQKAVPKGEAVTSDGVTKSYEMIVSAKKKASMTPADKINAATDGLLFAVESTGENWVPIDVVEKLINDYRSTLAGKPLEEIDPATMKRMQALKDLRDRYAADRR